MDPDEAATELGVSGREVVEARDLLLDWRLLQPLGNGRCHVAVSPEIATADRTQADMARIRELQDSVRKAQGELARLASVYAQACAERGQQGLDIEVIESPEAVGRVVYDAAGRCRERGYILHPRVAFRAEAHEASKRYDRELVERGVDRRNLYHEGTQNNAATRRVVAALAPIGVKFRVLPSVPVHAIIYDDDLAILSRRQTPDDRAALVVRNPDLIFVIRTVFETLWDHARPFVDSDAVTQDREGPSEVQLRVLRGLAAGLPDDVVARRIGIHVRTLRRHLTALEEMVGVESRFQLALRAKDLGWL